MKTKIELEWVSCEDRLPNDELEHFLVIVREKWSDDEGYQYHIDLASNYGDYIDDYWDTWNDWKEGQEVHITHWAKFPEDELLDIIIKNINNN